MRLNKMPSIDQFRQCVRNIKHSAQFVGVVCDDVILDRNAKMPILEVTGTVKVHGTHAGVSIFNDEIYCQSKKNVITVQQDNAGFASFVEKRKDTFDAIFDCISWENKDINFKKNIVTILGEFAGKGIQSGVAVSELDKKFYIFGIKIKPIDENIPSYWIEHNGFLDTTILNNQDIYIIEQFGEYKLTIDFNEPMMYNNEMIEMMEGVERECPVGKFFDVTSNTIGEGLVFKTYFKDSSYIWKTKGTLHAGKSKIKKQKKVDNVKLQKIIDVVEQVTPQWRLEQAFSEVFDIINGGQGDIKKTGDYLRWMINDIWKEDSDIIVDLDLTAKDVNGRISKVGREYLMNRLDEEVM